MNAMFFIGGTMNLSSISNTVLLSQIKVLVSKERQILASILNHLQEIYQRKIYAELGYSNIIKYMIHELHYGESAAFRRYNALKLTIEIPETKEKIIDGSLSLANVMQIQTLLKNENSESKNLAIELIKNQTIKEAEKTLFEHFPQIEVKEKTFVKRDSINTQRISVTLEDSAISNLNKLKALTKNYSESEIIQLALKNLIDGITKEKKKSFKTKSKNARFIPARIKQEAKIKANFICSHPKCDENHFLEVHHKLPIACGGKSTIDNLQVLCSTHHMFLHRQ